MSEQTTRARTIFRTIKNEDHPFVMIDRRPVENPSLSWGAKGVLAYLLSRPDNWTVRLQDLVRRSTDGVYKIRGYIKELRGAGHLSRVEKRDPKTKRIVEYVLEVYELPFATKPLTNLPQAVNLLAENLVLNDTDLNDIKDGVPPTYPIEWQIVSGAEELVRVDEEHSKRVDFSTLVSLGTSNPPMAYSLAMAFQDQRGITLPESKVKGQRKAIKEMLEMGVNGDHVREATKQLVNNKMTVADLFSVSKTAIDIANKPQEKIEFTRLL